MPFILTVVVVAVSLLILGGVSKNSQKIQGIINPSNTPPPSKKVLSPTVSPRLTETQSEIDELAPPQEPPQQNSSSQSWQYPGSSKIGSNTFESSDNPTKITDWYKGKIQSLGFNTTSAIATTTNGNVHNKLVASDGSSTVEIEIEKESGDTKTKISVTEKNQKT